MPSTKNETPKIINLTGTLIIDRAASLKQELVHAFEESSQVLVNLTGVEELDLSCLQVLYAARRQALADGKEFHFVGSVPERIARRLSLSGFLNGSPERAEDFEASLNDFH